MGGTLPSTGMWQGEVFAISDCLVVNGLISYNGTLNFVPTMEVSGNEKAKNVKYLPFMIVQIQHIEIQ